MTEQFFGKELAARKIEAIPGMIEFDIPVHGDNRGWFKEGKVLGSWVDLREGDSFGHVYQTVIDASKGIFVPRGVANGFQVLSDKVSYSYLVNDYWALELKPKYAFVNYADPTLGIKWENLEEAEVSEADKNHPLLKDVKPLRKEDL